VSFVPKVIPGGKDGRDGTARAPSEKLGYAEIVDINRLSQAFFRIQSGEVRQRLIAFIEDVAEAEYSESRL